MLHFPTEITGIMNRYKIELVGYIFSFQLIVYNGQPDYWWLRSPNTSYIIASGSAFRVRSGGDVLSDNAWDGPYGRRRTLRTHGETTTLIWSTRMAASTTAATTATVCAIPTDKIKIGILCIEYT